MEILEYLWETDDNCNRYLRVFCLKFARFLSVAYFLSKLAFIISKMVIFPHIYSEELDTSIKCKNESEPIDGRIGYACYKWKVTLSFIIIQSHDYFTTLGSEKILNEIL